jgi:hypothetical protein
MEIRKKREELGKKAGSLRENKGLEEVTSTRLSYEPWIDERKDGR